MQMRQLAVPAAALVLLAVVACADPDASNGADGPGAAPDARPTAEGVVPLAKVEGWRAGLGDAGTPFGVLEIAFDRDTAELAWRENVPDGLPAVGEVPDGPGLFGDLDDIDFDRQVVVVWSSGESGSCPGWLGDVRTAPDGAVQVERRDITSMRQQTSDGMFMACTDDYRAYRMVLGVDRDKLPDISDLPTAGATGVLDIQITAYPSG
jgi:hypothetical protein